MFASKLQRWGRALTGLYLIGLMAWLLMHQLVGDRLLYMTLVNAAAVAFFIPLPFVLPIVWRWPNARVRLAWLVGLFAFLAFWGPLLAPGDGQPLTQGDSLRLLTYNAQGGQGEWDLAVETIAAAEADIVALQELTPGLARQIESELGDQYPHRFLDPRLGSGGMGLISRIPFEVLQHGLPTQWNGHPILASFDWQGGSFTLLNVHTLSSGPSAPGIFRHSVQSRRQNFNYLEQQIPVWLEQGPLVIAGDFNITPLNEGYDQMTVQLRDTWREVGRGLGHTYPVPNRPNGLVVLKYGIPVPQRLIRIDYVFVSDEWLLGSADVAEYHGGGDHLGLLVEMALPSD
jgi:endonuclease/exonuclease/phosphatase (EEP) superfamily protein YafD